MSSSKSSPLRSSGRPRFTARAVLAALRLAFLRVALPALVRRVALHKLVRLLASPRTRPRDGAAEELTIAMAGRLWRRSTDTCLERSLAIHRELGRAGAKPSLLLAMRRDGDLVGHAWVEVDGDAVLEASDPRLVYEAVVAFDAAGRPSAAER
jgi:hypothetical protein